jgi:hypothetical protein
MLSFRESVLKRLKIRNSSWGHQVSCCGHSYELMSCRSMQCEGAFLGICRIDFNSNHRVIVSQAFFFVPLSALKSSVSAELQCEQHNNGDPFAYT